MKVLCALALAIWIAIAAPAPDRFRFVIIGDRTGETGPGIYERVMKEVVAEKPAFVVGIGDTIQGLNDATAEAEWKAIVQPKGLLLYQSPGNHDIWSDASEKLFTKYTGHPPHYSFDYGPAHFTILDNSRTEQFTAAEMTFLEDDLKAHAAQPLKFVLSHRPSWILNAMIGNPDFELQHIAKKYGVQFVIAGHIHKLIHAEIEGITYISMGSAGGHLRDTEKYEDGWFFGYAVAEADAHGASIQIKELGGRTTNLGDWGKAGLIRR